MIGIDESGTGAIAGPFTVAAFMSHSCHTSWLKTIGAADSKTLSHNRRRALFEALAPAAVIASIEVVAPSYVEQKQAWRDAIIKTALHCLSVVPSGATAAIKIDGTWDSCVTQALSRYRRPEYIVKGDQLIPQISAASILAKVVRSEEMLRAHQRFPMYGWSGESGKGNEGYGTSAHFKAIEAHGVCELHRRVQPLLAFFDGAQSHAREGVRIRERAV